MSDDDPLDELAWARSRREYPEPQVPEPIYTSPLLALRVVGWIIAYLTFAPPIAVILWRLATAPWP